MSRLTAEYLREILDYDPETGEFRWKWRDDRAKSWNVKWAGTVAGTLCHGYIRVTVDYRFRKAHRLAWLYVYGAWPANQIDHINNDRADNRITNLREATNQENNRNVGLRKTNSTGITGVSWHKRLQKYQAHIMVDKKSIYLGLFPTLEAAAAARAAAEIKYFGEFRRAA
jgi:hypothetical protein